MSLIGRKTPKKEISKGQIMRILNYKIFRFPNLMNISIKDQKGDTVCDAFGATAQDALGDSISKGWDIGYDDVPKIRGGKQRRRERRVRRGARVDKLKDEGWGIREMWYVIEEEPDGRFSLSVKNHEHDAAELTIYGKTIDELYRDIYLLGYEFFLGYKKLDKEQLFIWTTFVR